VYVHSYNYQKNTILFKECIAKEYNMNIRMLKAAVAGLVLSVSGFASATLITTGSGTAVTSSDLSAYFDALIEGYDITSYTEGGLDIFAPGNHCCKTGTFYESGGNNSWITISTTSNSAMFGVEFLLDMWWRGSATNYLFWETSLDGAVTGSGINYSALMGDVIGFSDTAGFDTLRVGANYSLSQGLGFHQAIAIDNLSVQTSIESQEVPEPSTLAIFALGIMGLASRRFKKQ
jgi:hypothetical protein